ncbi:oxidoreductase [Fulvivirga ligni]|uniref:oxidoreductase n=1 Tax=Fulvivirga ligni TaxID=2904246 RepID=UPI001F383303|nr:oxidoreductase [Fulvivirga ligni]UII20706.1 oxidoreductase [Fulvivirga ligni]
MEKFDLEKIPSHEGEVAIVTGANAGLGYETALQLARKDFEVILACRDQKKATKARSKILKAYPKGKLHIMTLDLGSFKSIKTFADKFISNYNQLQLLVNNAGLMMPPYQTTDDGFESQFGINYLGHFLLTGLLMPVLLTTSGARVISLSSMAHKWTDFDFEKYNAQKEYSKTKAYGMSKLACLMFAYELDRRLHNTSVKSLAAHPGVSLTSIARHIPAPVMIPVKLIAPIFFQPPKKAALPILRAALDPKAQSGEYYGPDGFMQYKGNPVKVDSNDYSKDKSHAKELWRLSQELVNLKYLD